jgi:hypothetical protein
MQKHKPVIFSRIGWMEYYKSVDSFPERPEGGGSYNDVENGEEEYNFKDLDGKFFGYVQPPGERHRIDVSRFEESADRYVEGILVIFFATIPERLHRELGKGQRIVGWYRDALVFEYFHNSHDDRRERKTYNLLAASAKGTLLPLSQRKFAIPANAKGKTGRSNITYYPESPTDEQSWMKDAVSYVNGFHQDIGAAPHPDLDHELERAAGFEPDPTVRKTIEDWAMKAAISHYEREGYKVIDTHLTESHDLQASRQGKSITIEVKGTRTDGASLLFTGPEIVFSRANMNHHLFVLHSISVNDGKASGGTAEIIAPFDPKENQLRAISYTYFRKR